VLYLASLTTRRGGYQRTSGSRPRKPAGPSSRNVSPSPPVCMI